MEVSDFSKAAHTLVVSDIHLADAEPPHPRNPLWKRFKRPKHFVDRTFRAFLQDVAAKIPDASVELIFNGDIFDFDAVMSIPEDIEAHVNWLERIRGLAAEETKSRFKMKVILDDHPVWLEAVRAFVLAGNRAIFVIGNHDMELHWPSVRQDLLDRFCLPPEAAGRVRFCEWFYISNQDTLIEHGNQYDAYCLCSNPINPLIKKGGRAYVRLPFGNLAGKFMINGMGLMNPHANSSFIKSSIWEYIVFYYRHVMRTQPLLLWTWFWSACVTLVYSVSEGLLPAMTDPLTVDARVEDISKRSNASPRMVWALKELHVHPAIFNPFKILRELWLDRAILLALIIWGSFQFFSFLRVFSSVSIAWFIIPVALLLPLFIFYARSVQSEVDAAQDAAMGMLGTSAKIAAVRRVVHGHTHLEKHTTVDGIEYLNTGTWSPAYEDVECTKPYGRKCFAWIRPAASGHERTAELYEWKDDAAERVTPAGEAQLTPAASERL
jgi:UDP-2,3-diacylglucosamine pyrophosphatase LpxH